MALVLWIGMKDYRHTRSILFTDLYRNGISYFICLFCESDYTTSVQAALLIRAVISTGNVVVILTAPV
jgi:hypothetical protein